MNDQINSGPDPRAPGAAWPLLRFDAQEFMHLVQDEELTEAQALELLGAVWTIMVAFVDLRFGIHPIQQAVDGFDHAPLSEIPAMLSCREVLSNNANQKTAGRDQREPAAKEES